MSSSELIELPRGELRLREDRGVTAEQVVRLAQAFDGRVGDLARVNEELFHRLESQGGQIGDLRVEAERQRACARVAEVERDHAVGELEAAQAELARLTEAREGAEKGLQYAEEAAKAAHNQRRHALAELARTKARLEALAELRATPWWKSKRRRELRSLLDG